MANGQGVEAAIAALYPRAERDRANGKELMNFYLEPAGTVVVMRVDGKRFRAQLKRSVVGQEELSAEDFLHWVAPLTIGGIAPGVLYIRRTRIAGEAMVVEFLPEKRDG